MSEQQLQTARGGILYEPSVLSKPSDLASGISSDRPGDTWFEPEFWQRQGLVRQVVGGRGSVWFIYDTSHTPPLAWVLRHYRRGGLIAKWVDDRYLWCGAAATRSFREWRLLAYLRARHLPVPVPVAARYVRNGFGYRADLITQEIVGARSLTQRLSVAALPPQLWQRIGATLARFHAIGAQHADLNAHNIVLNGDDEVHVLDFDRGRIRNPGAAWIQRVLARLHRSLSKLQIQQGIHFDADAWRVLLDAHNAELARLRHQAGQTFL